jgi:hypothetical protein
MMTGSAADGTKCGACDFLACHDTLLVVNLLPKAQHDVLLIGGALPLARETPVVVSFEVWRIL